MVCRGEFKENFAKGWYNVNRRIGNVSKKGTWQKWGGEKMNGGLCSSKKKTMLLLWC